MAVGYDAGHSYGQFEDYEDEEVVFEDSEDEDSYYEDGEESDEDEINCE